MIIRGVENIYPAEIEAAINEFDIIDDVRVIGVPHEFFGEEVCACLKLKSGKIFDENKIRAELSMRLAKFKIPAHFFVYDKFPLLGSGKVDVVSLRQDALKNKC